MKHSWIVRVTLVAAILFSCQALSSNQHVHYELQYFKERYSKEIYGFCLRLHYWNRDAMARCMRKQEELKDRILANAHNQMGRDSLAQATYDECMDYYPRNGVARIGACVATRLILFRKLGEPGAERKIYRYCDRRWRHFNAQAVTNCAAAEASYYRDRGEFRHQ